MTGVQTCALPILFQDIFERRPVYELFQQKGEIPGLVHAVEGHDVGVGQSFEDIGLALETLDDKRVSSQFAVQHFHGQRDVALDVPDAVDRAHAAGGDKSVHAELVE